MAIKFGKKWPFYGASLVIHLVLVWVLSLLPQGLGNSPWEKMGRGEVYRVEVLGIKGYGGRSVSPSPKRPLSRRRDPSPGSSLRTVTKESKPQGRVERAVVVVKREGKVTRKRVRLSSPGARKGRVQTSSQPQIDPSLLTEPGYGEGVLLAAMASGSRRGGSPGMEGKKRLGMGGIIPPMPLVNEKPPYPPLARRRGYEGRLVVRLLVSPSGRVERVVLMKSSGYSILDRVAVKTLKGWRFRPAMKEGRPVPFWVEVPVVFDLREARG